MWKREESLVFILAPNWIQKHRHMWAQTIMYVRRRSMKEKRKT